MAIVITNSIGAHYCLFPQSSTIDTSNRWFLLLLSSGKSLTSRGHWRHSIHQNLRTHRKWVGSVLAQPQSHCHCSILLLASQPGLNLANCGGQLQCRGLLSAAAAACCWFWLRWQQLHAQCRHNLVTSAHVYTVQYILHCSTLTFVLHITIQYKFSLLWSEAHLCLPYVCLMFA